MLENNRMYMPMENNKQNRQTLETGIEEACTIEHIDEENKKIIEENRKLKEERDRYELALFETIKKYKIMPMILHDRIPIEKADRMTVAETEFVLGTYDYENLKEVYSKVKKQYK